MLTALLEYMFMFTTFVQCSEVAVYLHFITKLSDFGLARGIHEKNYYRVTGQTKLPVRWMAPESLLYGIFTAASDVW